MLESSAQKHILVVQDLSCLGACAAMETLPVLSLLGHRPALLPTVLLSTHTGGYGPVYRRGLETDCEAVLCHWTELGLSFDAIMTGYLAGANQAGLIKRMLESFKTPNTLLFVDPVMGDGGKAYSFCDAALIELFKQLCQKADYIFPNLTEAALLLGLTPYERRPEALLTELRDRGFAPALLKGVERGDEIGVLWFNEAGEFSYHGEKRYSRSYPGSGDLFAAAFTGLLIRGFSEAEAVKQALRLLDACFAEAEARPGDIREGLPYERFLATWAQGLPEITEGRI